LRKLLGSFEKSLPLAIAAYNAGPSAVGEWLVGATDLDADVWVARIPFDETRSYVARVLGNLARYEWLAGGDVAVLRLPVELPRAVRPSSDLY
jgi:soluble lytic murein transglycosylase